MSGSFWKFNNGFSSLSNISALLENHAVTQDECGSSYSHTLEVFLKLLDEKDLFQELLSNNPMLVEFLRDDTVLSILVNLVIHEGEISKLGGTKDITDVDVDDEDEEDEEEVKDDDVKEVIKEVELKDVHLKNVDEENITDDTDDEIKDDDDEDETETAEESATRRATIAAEILSADVWSLTDTVMESTENLNKLWSTLDPILPLSINLSTYFMKIMEHLLDMKCDEMITYLIDNQPKLVEKFMKHLSNPPLMDFLLKLILTDKPENSTGIIDFLQDQGLISQLISSLDITDVDNKPQENHDLLLIQQSSAADFLKALITISANSNTDNSTIGPNELTRELVSSEQMVNLCKIMLKGGYALANGVGIIIEIIRKNNSDYDILPVMYITVETHPPTGRDPIYLGHLLKVFGSKISHFNSLLMNSLHSEGTNKLKTPFGEIEPLGFERFKICELIAELLHCSNMALLNDNKGFDYVKERDELRRRMREYDPISFKYNELIVLPKEHDSASAVNSTVTSPTEATANTTTDDSPDFSDDSPDDTVDSFNSRLHNQNAEDLVHEDDEEDEEAPHANTNLTEEQIRANPVAGDFLKISLFDTQIISNILTMFFKFPWNNFLHNVVFDIVQQVLNGSMDIGFNKFLAIDLFHLGDITSKIIEGQKLCTDYEKSHNGLRLGFMGHLTLIAEEVVKFIQLYPTNSLSELIDVKVKDEVWEEYVSEVLYDTREKYNAILGGGEDDDEAEEDEDEEVDDDEEDEDEKKNSEEGVDDDIPRHEIVEVLYEGDEVVGVIKKIEKTLAIDEDDAPKKSKHKTIKNRFDSDESESDDDDHFSNYMSGQLTSTANTEFVHDKGVTNPSVEQPYPVTLPQDDDEDYIDPNDDGMSYKKTHPLYDSTGSLLKSPLIPDEELSSEDSSSSSSDNDDDTDDLKKSVKEVLAEKAPKVNSNELTRAASKG